jgi:hypothetical protein
VILSGADANTKIPGLRTTFSRLLDQAVYPRMQGAPAANMIAAKAAALGYAMSAAFDACMAQIRSTADEMVKAFQAKDYEVVGGCSENHTVLVRLRGGITGAIGEAALGHCGIIVNKHRVPDDPRSALVTSGLRIGTGCSGATPGRCPRQPPDRRFDRADSEYRGAARRTGLHTGTPAPRAVSLRGRNPVQGLSSRRLSIAPQHLRP